LGIREGGRRGIYREETWRTIKQRNGKIDRGVQGREKGVTNGRCRGSDTRRKGTMGKRQSDGDWGWRDLERRQEGERGERWGED
jgi:hypothetical protein